jgi:uncharacterized protein DUF6798
MKALLWAGGVFFITALGYQLFPGHTYLQSDTQIYIPMLERLRDPALFSRDIVALRPHLMFTVYDEAALFLRRFGSFEAVLTAQQLVFRALAVCGLILIALRFGLSATQSFFVAAVVSLGATIVGPAVLTIEYEPVPRGFAISLIVFALGLIAQDRPFAAGTAAGIAFLYHPPTTLPFWGLAILLVFAKRLWWTILAPLAIASVMLAILAKLQPPGIETASIMRRLDPTQEALQRLRAGYSFVSTWNRNTKIDFALQALIAALGFWRLRKFANAPLRDFLWGLPVIGLLSLPFSWLLLERDHWALIPEWQPARAILFVSLIAALLAAVAAIKAANLVERLLWLTAAFLIPVQHAMLGSVIHYRPLALAAGLAVVTAALIALSPKTRGATLIAAGVIPFFAIPQSKLVENYPRLETADLRILADWARVSTPQPALFLFPDSGTSLDPGIFRARAQRGLYVDWKSGGQVNYFPEFARQWWTRWVETGSGRWSVAPEDFPKLAALGVDYVVLKNPVTGGTPQFTSARYFAYATSSRDSR